jgi:phytoene dehydrogenase-like protein
MKRVAIIGAGIGGLCAANLLAKKGHKVKLFEAHSAPGGYTAGFWKKGFYFESGTLSFESSPLVFKAMKDIGVHDRIDFARQAIGIRFAGVDGVCRSYRDLKELILTAFPQDRDSLSRYFAQVDKMCRTMMAVMRPAGAAGFLLYPLRLAAFLRLYRKYKAMTITDFTAGYFGTDSGLYRFFKSLGYPDMSAAIIPGAYLSFFDDYWTVRSGMQSWADMLAKNFTALGGEIRLNAPVERIITKNGAAAGVVSSGTQYDADYVISAADYKKTFLRLLDDRSCLPDGFLAKIEKNSVSESVFTAYLGLKIDKGRLKECMKVPLVHYFDEVPGADIRNADDDKYFEKASMMLYSPSLHDPRLAPAGNSSLMLQTAAPYRWMDNWGGGKRDRYLDLKERTKTALISKASRVIPGLENEIVFHDAATPLTYERFTGNTDGATSAWSWNPKNRFYRDIMNVHVTTPVKNLLIASCWACQIGGVPGAISAARACLKRIK